MGGPNRLLRRGETFQNFEENRFQLTKEKKGTSWEMVQKGGRRKTASDQTTPLEVDVVWRTWGGGRNGRDKGVW